MSILSHIYTKFWSVQKAIDSLLMTSFAHTGYADVSPSVWGKSKFSVNRFNSVHPSLPRSRNSNKISNFDEDDDASRCSSVSQKRKRVAERSRSHGKKYFSRADDVTKSHHGVVDSDLFRESPMIDGDMKIEKNASDPVEDHVFSAVNVISHSDSPSVVSTRRLSKLRLTSHGVFTLPRKISSSTLSYDGRSSSCSAAGRDSFRSLSHLSVVPATPSAAADGRQSTTCSLSSLDTSSSSAALVVPYNESYPRGYGARRRYRSRGTSRRSKYHGHHYDRHSSSSSSWAVTSKTSSSSVSGSNSFFVDLPLEWWERGEACKDAKADHMDRVDNICYSREDLVLLTTLWRYDTVLEPNMFPYDCPYGVEHYTLWSVYDLSHREIQSFVDNWLTRHHPQVRRWQYDDNSGERSIDLFHVHVFIEMVPFAFQARPEHLYIPPHMDKR